MSQEQKKVLIIDDEGDLVEMLGMRLEKAGYLVKSALDGASGLEQALNFKPEAVFLDISMPGMSGWEVCERLRAEPETRDIKIFILTATRDLKAAKKAGADRVILKPFNYDEILGALK